MTSEATEHIVNLAFAITVVFVLIMLWTKGVDYIEKTQTEQVEQYCYIDAKYTKTHLINKVATKTYYIDVHVTDAPELTHSITIPASAYNEIEEGMEVKCILYYTDEKLVDIEIE